MWIKGVHICVVQSSPVAPKMCRPWEQVGRAECGTQRVKYTWNWENVAIWDKKLSTCVIPAQKVKASRAYETKGKKWDLNTLTSASGQQREERLLAKLQPVYYVNYYRSQCHGNAKWAEPMNHTTGGRGEGEVYIHISTISRAWRVLCHERSAATLKARSFIMQNSRIYLESRSSFPMERTCTCFIDHANVLK